VRGDVGGHAHRDARAAVGEEVRDAAGQDDGLLARAVVVGDEIHRLHVDVGHHLGGHLRHARLGVTHRRRGVAVDGAEVALPVHEGVAQAEILRHAHQGVVDRRVAVGMVFAHDFADDARRLLVGLVGAVAQVVHGVEDATMDGLQAVSYVGKRSTDDDAHRIVEIGALHLLFDGDRNLVLGCGLHPKPSLRGERPGLGPSGTPGSRKIL